MLLLFEKILGYMKEIGIDMRKGLRTMRGVICFGKASHYSWNGI